MDFSVESSLRLSGDGETGAMVAHQCRCDAWRGSDVLPVLGNRHDASITGRHVMATEASAARQAPKGWGLGAPQPQSKTATHPTLILAAPQSLTYSLR